MKTLRITLTVIATLLVVASPVAAVYLCLIIGSLCAPNTDSVNQFFIGLFALTVLPALAIAIICVILMVALSIYDWLGKWFDSALSQHGEN